MTATLGAPVVRIRRAVLCLGVSQLVCWGVTFYLIGIFAEKIADDLGWSRVLVHGGFSVALVVMGVVSPLVGRLIDRYGGRSVMAAGSVLSAIGCAGIAASTTPAVYYASWVCLGAAMRCVLYDAAFAALARLAGPAARRPISQITLLGGLASTVFWPIGHGLAEFVGWRGAVAGYAVIALLTLPLHLALPDGRYDHAADEQPSAPAAGTPRDRRIAGSLYAVIVVVTGFLASGMSAHMIGILSGLGLATATAVWVSSLRGIAQSAARLLDVIFGRGVHPLNLNLVVAMLIAGCFAAGFGGGFLVPAVAFSVLFGAGNGLATITRGTMPLVLFGHRGYGSFVGHLLIPGFVLSAAAPVGYAFVIERAGETGALAMSGALVGVMLLAATVLRARYRRD